MKIPADSAFPIKKIRRFEELVKVCVIVYSGQIDEKTGDLHELYNNKSDCKYQSITIRGTSANTTITKSKNIDIYMIKVAYFLLIT